MGGEDWKEKVDRTPYIIRIAAVTIILFFPAITGYLSWATLFIPLLLFFLLSNFEEERVYAHLIPALAAGGIVSLFLHSLPAYFMAASLLPAGHALSYAARREYPVWRSGLTACLALALIWFLGGVFLNLTLDKNLYREIIARLDSILVTTFKMYRDSGELTPEMASQLNEAIKQLRVIIARIFPAIALNTIIITVWLNQLLGNWLLKKTDSTPPPWPEFNKWRVPDKLVWLLIGAGFALLLPQPVIQGIGLNLFLILGLVYSLQGLAVLSFLLTKWEVPILFQVIIFSLILLQTYSIIILAFLGLADIWFNLRKEKQIT
ncbi:MAG: DUF2232 domain-containing protein [Desulfurivibrionaceae bacterium]